MSEQVKRQSLITQLSVGSKTGRDQGTRAAFIRGRDYDSQPQSPCMGLVCSKQTFILVVYLSSCLTSGPRRHCPLNN